MRPQDSRFTSYLRQVDEAMMRSNAIRFSQIRSELESYGSTPPMTEAMAARIEPTEYASMIARRFGFMPATTVSAGDQNRYISALVEFASENPNWIPGDDGAVYGETASGVVRIRPDFDFSQTKLGFLTSFAEGATLMSHDGIARVPDAEFKFMGAALDIEEALEKLDAKLEDFAAPRM